MSGLLPGFQNYLDLREAHPPDEWILLTPLVYVTVAGEMITVPRGFITDLASIPQALRGVIDTNGVSRSPAVLHDYLYCIQDRPREQCDDLMIEALRSRGASRLECDVIYFGIRLGGSVGWDNRAGHGLVPGYDMVPQDYWLTSPVRQ